MPEWAWSRRTNRRIGSRELQNRRRPRSAGKGKEDVMKSMSKRYKTLFGTGFGLLFSLVAISPIEAQTSIQPPLGMTGWWPGDGDANDIIGGNSGALQGGASFTAAKVGLGFTFDSDDDRVTIPHNTNLDVTSPGFTVEFWMRGIKNQPHPLYAPVDKSHGFIDNTGWAFQGDAAVG